MPPSRPGPSRTHEPPASLVLAELDRILASELFTRSDRLSAFLKFIVHQSLAGQGHLLKEQVIAVELYGKGADFNTAADPIVRVDARRLRDRLREYYASAPLDGVVISVPKGSYTPTFHAGGDRAGDSSSPRFRRHPWLIGAITTLLFAVVAIVGWRVTRGVQSQPRPFELITVTSSPGAEGMPAISPDGNFVAFTATGPDFEAPGDLWVKAVRGDAIRRLTDTPDAHDVLASWSPDGQRIAFTRFVGQTPGIFLVSPLGGAEQKVIEPGSDAAWLPDSKSLVIGGRTADGRASLFLYVLESGERRQLTHAPPAFVDNFPRVSPDGKTLAFARTSTTHNQSAVLLVPIAGGEPVRVTQTVGLIGRLDWTPDGKEIIYPRLDLNSGRIFRIDAFGTPGRTGAAVPGMPFGVNMVSVSRQRIGQTFRLAFSYGQPDVGLRLIDLHAAQPDDSIAAVTPFCDATRMDMPGRFSRDGGQVAFASDRSGSPQIWVADRDGSRLRSITDFRDVTVNAGAWSPDGHGVVLEAVVNGNPDIYLASADGQPLRRLTSAPARDIDPEWSRDGQWIYFASDASGAVRDLESSGKWWPADPDYDRWRV